MLGERRRQGPDRDARRERRCQQWSEEEKTRIVAETFARGADIFNVARRNGVNGELLLKWRRATPQLPAASAAFIPITLASTEACESDVPASFSYGSIEVDVAGACIRVQGVVSKAVLKTVLTALRETA
jgi:hypothetical protein